MGAGEDILKRLDAIEAKIDRLLSGGVSAPTEASGGVAADSELDGPHGDPQVRAIPRGWVGEDFKGRKYSETSADFLLKLAVMLDYFADKKAKEDPKKSGWDRLDAKRARAWSKRLASGWTNPNAPSAAANPDGW